VNANHVTVYGNIVSKWKKTGNIFDLDLMIPPNTAATIFLPAKKGDIITENKRTVSGRKEIRLLGYENGRAKLETGSGTYSFTVISK
jgi:alpha-L-rhamnosidase